MQAATNRRRRVSESEYAGYAILTGILSSAGIRDIALSYFL